MTAAEEWNERSRRWLGTFRQANPLQADRDARTAVYAVAVAQRLGAPLEELIELRLAAETLSAPEGLRFDCPTGWAELVGLATRFDLMRNVEGRPLGEVLESLTELAGAETVAAFEAVDRQITITLD